MNTAFLRKGGAVRKHAANSIAGLIAGTIMGTVVPMAQQWHSDAQADKARAEFKADIQKQLDDLKEAQHRQWQALAKKRDY